MAWFLQKRIHELLTGLQMHILLTCILCITLFFFFCFIPWSNFLSTKLLIHKHKIKFEKKKCDFWIWTKTFKKKSRIFLSQSKSQQISKFFAVFRRNHNKQKKQMFIPLLFLQPSTKNNKLYTISMV